MQWQPIETAPKDGTWILLRGFEPDDFSDKLPPIVVAFWLSDDPDEKFWAYCYWDSDWRSGVDNPTHWMPLPAPPDTAKESRFVQVACWCERCELAANHGMATRMSLCPECGDKRCPRSEWHGNDCQKQDTTQKGDGDVQCTPEA